MKKPAITSADIHPIIRKRWSPRSFSEQQVDNETLETIFEAARWAPSSFNEQPWRFIVGHKGDPTFEKILEGLVEFNQKWSKEAPVLVVTVAKKTFTKSGKTNRVNKFDLGQSVAYFTFQAYEMGLVMHQMGGMELDKMTELFNIPEDYEPHTAFALGYQAHPDNLSDSLRKSELSSRSRKNLDEFVFTEQFGNPFF